MSESVGLDFGQSQCRMAYWDKGQPIVLTEATHLSQVRLRFDTLTVPKGINEFKENSTRGVALDIKSKLGNSQQIVLGENLWKAVDLA